MQQPQSPTNFIQGSSVSDQYLKQQELQQKKFMQSPIQDIIGDVSNTNTQEPFLTTTNYSDKSFIVYGSGTKDLKQYLSNLGGKYNGRLASRPPNFPGGGAWIYPMGKRQEVENFVNNVTSGNLKFNNGTLVSSQVPESGINLPYSIVPLKNESKYQRVNWSVFKPKEGMTAIIKVNGAAPLEGTVTSTETHNDIVDTVYITIPSGATKLVICNGKWQVWGYMAEHNIFFNDGMQPSSPSKFNY